MKKKLVIPNQIKFPFGYVVKVRQVLPVLLPGGVDGTWDADSRVIMINKLCNIKRRRYLITHEMQHALTDWTHWIMDNGYGSN